MNKKILGSAIVMACAAAGVSTSAQAALASNSVLNFNPGVTTVTSYGTVMVKTGSYFGMDTGGDGKIIASERTAISQNNGIILGTAQAATGSHGGAPGCAPTGLPGDTCNNTVPNGEMPGIDAAWNFFGNTGMHFSATPITVISSVGGAATLDFSGWNVTWAGIPGINMGGGAWGTGFVNGQANVVCGLDCAVGDTYTLDYNATVPLGDPSNFGGVMYTLHLVGTIGAGANPVPVPAAAWLFGSGLLGLAGVARRRKAA